MFIDLFNKAAIWLQLVSTESATATEMGLEPLIANTTKSVAQNLVNIRTLSDDCN